MEGTGHPWGDTARSWIERRYVSLDLRFCLLGFEGGVSRILKVYSLLVNLKHESGK